MRILALDLGLNCGWAAILSKHSDALFYQSSIPYTESDDLYHGTWHLKRSSKEDFITPIARFRSMLEGFPEVSAVAYEDVKSIFRGNYAALNYGGLKTVIELYALEREIPIYPTSVGTIKKWATGKGNAKKKQMIETCRDRLKIKPRDSNEADALWLLDYIIKHHGGKTDGKG